MNKKMYVLNEGKFGPGTLKEIPINDSNWKAKAGAIDNKRRPEAVYLLLSTWISPQLSVVNARAWEEEQADAMAVKVLKEFKANVMRNIRLIRGAFSSKYFILDSLIFTMDLPDGTPEPGKSQYLELDLHIETINEIDDDGNAIPTKATGKIEQIHFDQLVVELQNAANKILDIDTFSNSNLVTFKKSKV